MYVTIEVIGKSQYSTTCRFGNIDDVAPSSLGQELPSLPNRHWFDAVEAVGARDCKTPLPFASFLLVEGRFVCIAVVFTTGEESPDEYLNILANTLQKGHV